MAGERHESTLVNVVNALGKGLQSWASSPAFISLVETELAWKRHERERSSVAQAHEVVKPDAVIEIEGFEEPIDLVRLRRTIGNLASSAKLVREWAIELPSDLNVAQGRANRSAMNHLYRMQRTLEALARLLQSDEVFSPFHAAAEEGLRKQAEADAVASVSQPGGDIVVVKYEAGHVGQALLVASVYSKIKKLRDEISREIASRGNAIVDGGKFISQLTELTTMMTEHPDVSIEKREGGQDG